MVTVTLTNLPPNSNIRAQVRVLNKYYAGYPSSEVEFSTSEGGTKINYCSMIIYCAWSVVNGCVLYLVESDLYIRYQRMLYSCYMGVESIVVFNHIFIKLIQF